MIAIVFLLVLVGLTVAMSFTGAGPGNLLIWESLLLVGLFCLFFGAGIYIAAALGRAPQDAANYTPRIARAAAQEIVTRPSPGAEARLFLPRSIGPR